MIRKFRIMKYNRLKFILLVVAFLLLLPLIAMQFTNEVNWTLMDFVVAAVLLLGAGLIFELVMRKIKNTKYRTTIIVILVLAFLLIWAELAVGIFGSSLSGS